MPHVSLTDRAQPITKSYTLTAEGQRMALQSRQTPAAPPLTAWATIEAHAEALIAKSAAPLTRQAAIAQIVETNPELYARYKAEGYRAAMPTVEAPVVKRHGAVWDVIVAHAEVLIAKSQAPLTKQAAVARVVQERPELYARYRAERRE